MTAHLLRYLTPSNGNRSSVLENATSFIAEPIALVFAEIEVARLKKSERNLQIELEAALALTGVITDSNERLRAKNTDLEEENTRLQREIARLSRSPFSRIAEEIRTYNKAFE